MRNRSSKESDPESQRLLSSSSSEEKKKSSTSSQKRKSRIEPFKCSPNLSLWDFLNPIKFFLLSLDVFLILVTFKWLSIFRTRSPKVVLKVPTSLSSSSNSLFNPPTLTHTNTHTERCNVESHESKTLQIECRTGEQVLRMFHGVRSGSSCLQRVLVETVYGNKKVSGYEAVEIGAISS